jgi:hypothetical protein
MLLGEGIDPELYSGLDEDLGDLGDLPASELMNQIINGKVTPDLTWS